MAELKNHLEVYKLLPKTNCRDCGLATCLAFAAMVIQQTKQLRDCPYIEPEVLQQYEVQDDSRPNRDEVSEQKLALLQEQIRHIDLAGSQERLQATFSQGRLAVSCLSKDFWVSQDGEVASGCHVNGWVTFPLLHYIKDCQGRDLTGEWVSLRELEGGMDWLLFFEHRCEKAMNKLVDGYTNLFEDLIDIFDARPAPPMFDSDIAVILHPLPRLPMLICYWKPEDGMGSSLNIFFDRSADKNLKVENIYTLTMGMVTMFEKIARTHGQ